MRLGLSPAELKVLEGELLGDGTVFIGARYTNAKFQLQTAYEGQLRFAQAGLHRLGGHTAQFFRKTPLHTSAGSHMWQWSTQRTSVLTEIHKKWYPAGTKIVPVDFRLTPASGAHWYVGDGSLHKQNPRIVFCTDSFDELSIERLRRQLYDVVGLDTRIRITARGHTRIELGVDGVSTWLSFIGPCPVPELAHKWQPNFRATRLRQFYENELARIDALAANGSSCSEIAKTLNRPYHSIYGVLQKRQRLQRR